MQIRKSKYKNIFAIDINTDKYVLKVLPSEGGKIASFITKKDAFEFLIQNPCKTYKKLYANGDFVMSECSGFDDMFPTIDAVGFVDDSGRKLHYLDHGEVCRGNFEYFILSDTLKMRYVSKKFNYEYIKIIREDENGRIEIKYEIINRSEVSLDVLWAGHCLVNL